MEFLKTITGLFRRKTPQIVEKIKPDTKVKTTKNETTMVNTLTLSSDMETLYLIDNDRAIPFPLTNIRGILIGTLKGQISVVSAVKAPQNTDIDAKPLKLSIANNQWTLFYNEEHSVLAVIGATDIDTSLAENTEIKTQIHTFKIEERVVHLKKKGDQLEFSVLK